MSNNTQDSAEVVRAESLSSMHSISQSCLSFKDPKTLHRHNEGLVPSPGFVRRSHTLRFLITTALNI